jgi:peroxidase
MTTFGQFVDHDIDLTPAQAGNSAETLDIKIPSNDQFFLNQSFIGFKRSQFVQEKGEARKHKNIITSWIDASQVYGSDADTNCALR